MPGPAIQVDALMWCCQESAGRAGNATLIRGDNQRRQRILETDSVLDRLRQVQALLRRELLVLETLSRPTQAALRRDIISPN